MFDRGSTGGIRVGYIDGIFCQWQKSLDDQIRLKTRYTGF